jgi:hypothetical protein
MVSCTSVHMFCVTWKSAIRDRHSFARSSRSWRILVPGPPCLLGYLFLFVQVTSMMDIAPLIVY